MRPTCKPNVRRRKKTHGFRVRMETKGGQKVIKSRRHRRAEKDLPFDGGKPGSSGEDQKEERLFSPL